MIWYFLAVYQNVLPKLPHPACFHPRPAFPSYTALHSALPPISTIEQEQGEFEVTWLSWITLLVGSFNINISHTFPFILQKMRIAGYTSKTTVWKNSVWKIEFWKIQSGNIQFGNIKSVKIRFRKEKNSQKNCLTNNFLRMCNSARNFVEVYLYRVLKSWPNSSAAVQ